MPQDAIITKRMNKRKSGGSLLRRKETHQVGVAKVQELREPLGKRRQSGSCTGRLLTDPGAS